MAKYISPQVVINERDVSAIAEEAFGNPYLILGEAKKGRDDRAILVTTKANFADKFGNQDPDMPSTYAALEYLSFGNQLWFKRVTSTKMVKIFSAASVTFSSKSTGQITLPGTSLPYITGDSTQDPIALFIKDTGGSYVPFKVYVTGWNAGNVYDITWDSYGTDWDALGIESQTFTADVFVSHAEPAFSNDGRFLKTGETAGETKVIFDATDSANWNRHGQTFDDTDYFVTSYANGSAFAPYLWSTSNVTASTGGSMAAGTYGYRIAFTDGVNESALSPLVSVTVSSSGRVIFSLPNLPTGFTGWNIYRTLVGGTDELFKLTTNAITTTQQNTFADTLADASLSTLRPATNPISVGINGTAVTPTTQKAVSATAVSSIAAVTFTGTGLDDATSGGTYTDTVIRNYVVEIDSTGAPDSFQWSDDGGLTWTTGVSITGGAQALSNGVTITFAATTGHTLGDYWSFQATPATLTSTAHGLSAAEIETTFFVGTGLNDAVSGGAFTGTVAREFVVEIDSTGTPDTFRWSKDGGATYDASGVSITGAAQVLTEGVSIQFGATTGHTLNEYWTFSATPSDIIDLAIWNNTNALTLVLDGATVTDVIDADTFSIDTMPWTTTSTGYFVQINPTHYVSIDTDGTTVLGEYIYEVFETEPDVPSTAMAEGDFTAGSSTTRANIAIPGHGFVAGEIILFNFATPDNPLFEGVHVIADVVDANNFEIELSGAFVSPVGSGSTITYAAPPRYRSTWVKGASPELAIGNILKKVCEVDSLTSGKDIDNGANTQSTVDVSILGQYLLSSWIPTTASSTSSKRLWRYTGLSTYAVADHEITAWLTKNQQDYYYYSESSFDRYALVAKGRGTWANTVNCYTAYNQTLEEFELLIFDENGNFVERWSYAELSDLVSNVNEFSDYVNMVDLPDSTSTDFATFDITLIGSSFTAQYYLCDLGGGYDGYFAVDEGDFIANIDTGVAGSKKAIDADYTDLVASAQQIEDFDSTMPYEIMAIPLFSSNPSLAAVMGEVAQTRKFSACILDTPQGLDANDVVQFRNTSFANINTSYSAIYWNFGKVYDAVNDVFVWLPPSVFAVRALAFTDSVAEPFYAAAGLRRGLVPEVLELEYYPTLGDREALAGVQLNPIARIGTSVAVWGQRTSQKQRTMLSNFNVRRMLVQAEKSVFLTSLFTLFEPNDETERRRLILTLEPIFDNIRQRRGIARFGLFDVTTDVDVANNTARFKIELIPVVPMEIISHEFVIKNPTQEISGT